MITIDRDFANNPRGHSFNSSTHRKYALNNPWGVRQYHIIHEIDTLSESNMLQGC